MRGNAHKKPNLQHQEQKKDKEVIEAGKAKKEALTQEKEILACQMKTINTEKESNEKELKTKLVTIRPSHKEAETNKTRLTSGIQEKKMILEN